ncbi:DNA phosphorothioation-dependent restriction protein DptH [Lysinibacillus fusiformis]|uniref:DNA phosphorothioation-dependent restriction protein DptH n=1 Tax=Lysinibacillus fusiformis TaxID=28031 RepID=UPI003D07E7DD
MSNQFYNYIAEELLRYWNNPDNDLQAGMRFFLRLDDPQEVLEMANALRGVGGEHVENFLYEHEFGDPYETFCLKFGDIRLVVAYTNDEVLTDYLALVRNLVSDQQACWENTALISIVSEQLDTIPGGSLDVQSEGMPLHVVSLSENLHDKILNSSLSKAEKIILNDSLESIVNEQRLIRLSIFEFEEILATLYKGQIEANDYKNLGLFIDSDLDTFSGKSLKNRLTENRELYEVVREANEFNNTEEQLQKHFTVEGSNEMKKDDWFEKPFTEVYKDHQKYLTENKAAKVTFMEIKSEGDEIVWDRPSAVSSSGKRKRHILVFNPHKNKEVTLIAKFNLEGPIKSLKQGFANPAKKVKEVGLEVKTSNIHIKIPTNDQGAVFAQFTYKHDNKIVLGAEFIICILPVSNHLFDSVSANYLIDAKKQKIALTMSGNKLVFGSGYPISDLTLENNGDTVSVEELGSYNISINPSLFEDELDQVFNLKVNDVFIPILINSELSDSLPITGARIWKLVRESKTDMVWVKELNRLMHSHREYYLQSSYDEFFEWEYKWIDGSYRSGKVQSGILEPVTIELSENLREAYSRFMACFKTASMIPSLTYISEEYEKRGKEYIAAYIAEINSFDEGKPAGKKGVNLYQLGMIEANDTIYITPFHPLMVAYKLKVYELLDHEEVENVILSRLSPEALIPFVDRGELYRPQHQEDVPEWLVLKSVNKVTAADSVQYLANVISDKMKQFKEHFGYLFTKGSKAPILINVMNLPDDEEVLKGILNFMMKEINSHGISALKSIEVTLYTDSPTKSAFEKFAQLKTVEQVEAFTNLKFKSVKGYDAETVLRVIRENLYFYRSESVNNRWVLRYAHITFYKMHAQESSAIQSMHEMRSDLALEGLYASVPAMRDAETYKSGFGVKGYSIEDNDYLIKTAYYVNELIGNSRNKGNDSYIKGNTVLSRVDTEDESTLLEIFEHSHWVTFIDPTVDLGFFKEFNNDLVVIHYSDQYTSSSKFDAITVTNKSDQYYKVIEEFLNKKEIEGTKENIINTIQAFNTFNGEWLLRIIGTKGYSDREKLSIISAIKYTLAYLNHENIKWVPISLEEILRVAGVFNLSKAGGIFSTKNLGVKGPASDDLLLIGLEDVDGELVMHIYPVEVKFGINGNDVISKAKIQVNKTKDILMGALVKNHPNTFKEKFYKNFFVQLLLSNINKMIQGDIWPSKQYKLSETVVEKLVKLDFIITDHLSDFIGKGAIVLFKEGLVARASYLDDGIQMIEFSKEDGFNGIIKQMDEINHWLHVEETDFIKSRFLKNMYDSSVQKSLVKVEPIETDEGVPSEENQDMTDAPNNNDRVIKDIAENHNLGPSLEDQDWILEQDLNDVIPVENENINKTGTDHENLEITSENEVDPVLNKVPLKDVRILIGKPENSNKDIYWEYGHLELANRHLLISGKSGQGKTYFMQCLLLEKSKQGISSLIIDYTEGFLPTQLEAEFVAALGNKFKQQIVYTEKLPINPFSRNKRYIGTIELPETNTDIAERIKSVFSAVYSSLGIQQLNMIYDRVLFGLDRYDSNMSLTYLKELLEEEGSSTALKTLSQIRPLIDRNPFTNENSIDWKQHIELNGEVFVVQLTGFPRDVQLMITEFLLWDLWNYSVRSGNKNTPMPVIMDEAQNLDHTDEAPSARILTEGRKFGWSAWFATQFLKAQMDSGELARLQNASQKIYFSQSDEDVSYIANTLVNEEGDRKYWEKKLLDLRKGQCIVQGPQLESNGSLSKPRNVIVNITPLSERM